MRTFIRIAVACATLPLLVGVAAADTQVILGKALVVKDPQPGVAPNLRKITVQAKELTSSALVVGDPVTFGADIQIIANGDNPSQEDYTIPGGLLPKGGTVGWKVLGDPVEGYSYKDKNGTNGPVKVAQIKKSASTGTFVMKATILGSLGPINVLPPDPGTNGGMIFTVGGGDSYCMKLGGTAGGVTSNSDNKTFKVAAKKDVPALYDGCPFLVLP